MYFLCTLHGFLPECTLDTNLFCVSLKVKPFKLLFQGDEELSSSNEGGSKVNLGSCSGGRDKTEI